MAHKVWSEQADHWVEASDERVAELQNDMVRPDMTVPLPPLVEVGDSHPLPEGLDPGDTVWMVFNEALNLDRARG